MKLKRLICPCCHASFQLERFESAFSGSEGYLVCPECDYKFIWKTPTGHHGMTLDAEGVAPVHEADGAGCSTSS